jgi:hypothetical protein
LNIKLPNSESPRAVRPEQTVEESEMESTHAKKETGENQWNREQAAGFTVPEHRDSITDRRWHGGGTSY